MGLEILRDSGGSAGVGGGSYVVGLVYEESTTAPDGNQQTFAFPDAISKALSVYIGGVAQLPSNYNIVGGNVVFTGDTVPTDPEKDRVSALFIKA